MKLIAYLLDGHDVSLRPAPLERNWMDASPQRFAYRCLPLAIANAYGWEILCPSGFRAVWDGEPRTECVKVTPLENAPPPAVSHFGSGVLTFHIPCLFRTEPGFNLLVQGPINRPKDAIAPLSAVVETDWAPYTFTMNWLFTQPEIEVEFQKGEPICHILPVRRGDVEAFEPEIIPLSADPDLQEQFRAWNISRETFNSDLNRPGSEAQAERWQKNYHRGLDAQGQPGAGDHQTRVRLKGFARRTRP